MVIHSTDKSLVQVIQQTLMVSIQMTARGGSNKKNASLMGAAAL